MGTRNHTRLSSELIEAFKEEAYRILTITTPDPDECWVWSESSYLKNDYPWFSRNRERAKINRLTCEAFSMPLTLEDDPGNDDLKILMVPVYITAPLG